MGYKVGEKIKDGAGNEWVIARIWPQGKWNDLDLIHTATGERGSVRVRANTKPKSKLANRGD